MKRVASRYKKDAAIINQNRSEKMTDNTVIMILSESFSDPTRVPGITLTEDPMPNIRQIKNQTTSGIMLSPGYGGGTANIEYQALSGLSMANYDSSLSIAYQQLVPNEKWTPTLNQLWNINNGKQSSVAYHDYYRNMYFRSTNYKKFGFSKFWTVDGTYKLKDLTFIDRDWTASDESLYNHILNDIHKTDKNQFLQVVTMQNHTPYSDWYDNNQFKDANISQNLSEMEKNNIDTYTKGVSHTDQSTQAFLNSLNEINRPISVIFMETICRESTTLHPPIKRIVLHYTKPITLSGLIKPLSQPEQSWTLFPVTTRHRITSLLNSLNILMRK